MEPVAPKDGARFHFELPGSVQGFMPEETVETKGTVEVENVLGHSKAGSRSLGLRYQGVAPGRTARVSTPTFIPSKEVSDYFEQRGYTLYASPTLYPGQTVRAAVSADGAEQRPSRCRHLSTCHAWSRKTPANLVRGPSVTLAPGASNEFEWTIADLGGAPIAQIGVEISSDQSRRGQRLSGLSDLEWHAEGQLCTAGRRQQHVAQGLGQRRRYLR